eukprot:CAMPEP_0198111980 /NCGR_PEP_ID=MMETSP1442-20131203/3902_1 /TAXON_ID= /ORGANISM="Craspedostauros australis, Strain CCMP3328" /LENGTH=135 /DNA_ID=CAMNT_0043768603 /DNA_START=309 /DNA_END=714 /DNA_ORIENTATION=-
MVGDGDEDYAERKDNMVVSPRSCADRASHAGCSPRACHHVAFLEQRVVGFCCELQQSDDTSCSAQAGWPGVKLSSEDGRLVADDALPLEAVQGTVTDIRTPAIVVATRTDAAVVPLCICNCNCTTMVQSRPEQRI